MGENEDEMGRSGKRREKKAKIDSQREWSKKEGKFWRKKPGCVKRKKEKFVKKMKLKKKWRQEETSWKTPQRNRKLTKRSRSKMKIFCWKKNTKYRREPAIWRITEDWRIWFLAGKEQNSTLSILLKLYSWMRKKAPGEFNFLSVKKFPILDFERKGPVFWKRTFLIFRNNYSVPTSNVLS